MREIISMYDKTGSIRATVRNLGLCCKWVTKYASEYLEAKSSSESDFSGLPEKRTEVLRVVVDVRRKC